MSSPNNEHKLRCQPDKKTNIKLSNSKSTEPCLPTNEQPRLTTSFDNALRNNDQSIPSPDFLTPSPRKGCKSSEQGTGSTLTSPGDTEFQIEDIVIAKQHSNTEPSKLGTYFVPFDGKHFLAVLESMFIHNSGSVDGVSSTRARLRVLQSVPFR